jgi:hypothetical protein
MDLGGNTLLQVFFERGCGEKGGDGGRKEVSGRGKE